ncbi:MAG: hypothetical protein JXR34_00370 [Bacteroidales bacterium]|nr:hypothetical protein [Bacteroidales bacterium]
MEDTLKVLSVSGGSMETEDNGVLEWGNLICLSDAQRDITKQTVGTEVYKIKFHMPKEQVADFVLRLKKMIAACPPENPVLVAKFDLGRKRSKTGEAIQVINGFVAKV